MMILNKQPNIINLTQDLKKHTFDLGLCTALNIPTKVSKNSSFDYQEQLANICEENAKQNPVLWSKKDDKLTRKNDIRNDTIENIRDKFLKDTKDRKHYYENKGNYSYKSLEHYKQFLEVVEAVGLVKKPEAPEKKSRDVTNELFDLELIKGYNRETDHDEDNYYSLKDLDRFQKENREDEL
jgi:hypothetical protein